MNAQSAPRESPGARHRLFWSFGAQAVAILLRIVQQLALVPILIRGWGPDVYGDWIVIFSTTSTLTILDFGMQIYFGNALLIALSRGGIAAYRRLFATATALYALVLGAALAALAGATVFISWPTLFGTHVMSADEVLRISLILALSTLMLIPFGLVTSLYRAHGDYSRGTAVAVIAEALRGFGICAVVWFGGSPFLASCVYLSIAILFGVGILLDQRRRYGSLPLGIALPRAAELREAAGRSSLYMASSVTTPVILNGPIILLGLLQAPAAAVVAYSAARTFTGFVRQIVIQFSQPIGAEMTRQQAAGDHVRLRRIFAGAGRMIGGVAGLLGGFALIAAPLFLRIWTRGEVVFDPWLVRAFIATIILTAPAQVALMLYQYNNKPGILILAQGGYAAGTVVFCLLLIGGYSAAGAAAGTGLAEFLSIGLLMPYAAAKEAATPLSPYLVRSYGTALAAFAVSHGAAWGIGAVVAAQNLLGLAVLGAAWGAAVAVPAFFIVLEPQERGWLLRYAGMFRSRFVPHKPSP